MSNASARAGLRPSPSHALRALVLLLVLASASACENGCGSQSEEPSADDTSAQTDDEGLKHGLTAEQAKQVIAELGDVEITLGQFAERLASQSPYLRARYNSPERRREFLENMVRFELLALEAKRRGHEDEPEVVRVRQQMMVQEMMKELFDEKGIKLSDITDAEIRKYYETHQEEFSKPEQRRASHILLKNKAKAESVLKQVLADPKSMKLFRELAKKHNTDEKTKERFGDLRFFSLEPSEDEAGSAPPKAVREAVFKLDKTGDVHASPIETEDGFHIVKMTGERAALNRSLEDARRLIQNRLWRQKREQAIEGFVSDLRKKADVKENLALLDKVEVSTDKEPQGAGQDAKAPEADK